jgi:phage shock protein A
MTVSKERLQERVDELSDLVNILIGRLARLESKIEELNTDR